MNITKSLLVAALAAAGLAATAAEAQNQLGRGSGGGMNAGSARSGSTGASSVNRGGSANWSGGGRHGGNWHGRPVGTGRGHWHSGGRGHYYGGSRYWGPRYGFYVGAPLFWGSYYWGSPYWGDYYYPRSTVVYTQPYPMSVPSYNEFEVAPADVAPRAEGAPTQAPAYRNYCDSAKAYYPKVTTCPEGWRFEPMR